MRRGRWPLSVIKGVLAMMDRLTLTPSGMLTMGLHLWGFLSKTIVPK